MSDEHEILDDEMNPPVAISSKRRFSYLRYTLSYLFLMLTVGPLFVKYIFQMNVGWGKLLIVSSLYVGYALIVSLIFLGFTYLLKKNGSEKSIEKVEHPLWFRILENCFYSWVVIIFVVYIGIKFL